MISIESETEEKPSISLLPKDVVMYTRFFLDLKNLGMLAQTCRGYNALFKPSLLPTQLLYQVMNGNPKELEKIFKIITSDNECNVLGKLAGKEKCGRSWLAISPLEFAAWAGDTELVNILLSKVSAPNRSKALEQLLNVQKNGLEGRKYLEPYYSLIDSYKEYIAKFQNWDWPACDDYWVHKIGMNQLMLPLVGLQWMCDKKPFDPLPSFRGSPERSCTLYDNTSLLPLSGSGLASRFALFKGPTSSLLRWPSFLSQDIYPLVGGCLLEIRAFLRLCEVKTKELTSIIEQLQKLSVKKEYYAHHNHCVIS